MLKVLIVDDIQTNVRLLEHLIKTMEYEPVVAFSGQQAIEVYQSEQPDIILMDVMMDDMDGFEAAQALMALADRPWLPLIFLSAAATDQFYFKGMSVGAYDYMFKPVNRQLLQAKLGQLETILRYQAGLIAENQQLKQQLAAKN